MVWRAVLALLILTTALGPSTSDATHTLPKPSCSKGETMFVDGALRILALSERTRSESSSEHYACLGRRAKPIEVGGSYSDAGTGYNDVPAYVYARGRYLGSYHYSDGEGGPSADFVVVDLRDRSKGFRADVLCCEDIGEFPEFLVAGDGSLVTIEEGDVYSRRPADKRSARVSDKAAQSADLAIRGATVYWSETGQTTPAAAKSMTLEGVPGSDEPHLLAPTDLPRPGSPCARTRGRTVAASAKVRVYVPSGSERRFACRYTRRLRRVSVGSADAPAPRVVGDRWVLLAIDAGAVVFDTVTRRRVTTVDNSITELTLLRDGTLAWIDPTGRVLAQRPDADVPTELGTGASTLASGGKTVYWTAAGRPQRATP